MRSASRLLSGFALTILLSFPAIPAASPNYQGLWWNSPAGSESGWGINLAHQGDVVFASWFTYDAGGKGWWLSMTATKASEGTYSGALIETTGPAFYSMPFDPAKVARTVVGSGTLAFQDADNGTFSYTAKGVQQSKSITRLVFGSMPTCAGASQAELATATNYQDLWWAAGGTESGWGLNLAHEGDIIFTSWFTYGTDGRPAWLSATQTKVAPNVYTGQLIRTTGPAFGTPFDPANVARTVVGSATLSFSNGNAAAFTYTLDGITQTKPITRVLFVPPVGTCCGPKLATTITGKVFDGAIDKAIVCADADGDGRCGPGESQALTDATGAYALAAPDGYKGPLVAEVVAGQSRDADQPTAVERSYRMASPSREYSTNITPFTTLVRLAGDADYRLAEEIVRNELGLPPRFVINLAAAPAAGTLTKSVSRSIVAALKDAPSTLDFSSPDALATVVAHFPTPLAQLPRIDINTHGDPITSRETYVDGHFTLANPASDAPPVLLNGKIRGRGNSTWWEAKKPYKVQITNDDAYAGIADFFGMRKNRNWVLLADHLDHSLLRNKLAYSLGNSSVFSDGLKWNPSGQHVEVTLNGEYIGVYLFAEDIRIDSTRLNIKKMSSSASANQVDGGYIVEVDYPQDCDVILQYTTPKGVRFCIDTPDETAITPAQNQYVRDYLKAVESDIYGSGSLARINAASFADWYLLQELFRNQDAVFYSSDRMWKDTDSAAIPGDRVLNIGPIWDFDISAGNSDQYQTEGCWVNKGLDDMIPNWPNWYRRIFDHREFLDLTIARWKDKRPALERFVNASIATYARRLESAQARNFERWPVLGTDTWNNHYLFESWEEEVAFVRRFLNDRMAWMDRAFASPEAYVALCK